ncbi:unnamed protein product [Soboliphyme baturini]|uniref:Ovule protein n=1 Tax=Soboliphyme baturini TaxID=241478 RepID=A0A183IGM1_9BILA|nr:unnamed protein product [Soboliphyme baturini]
MQKNRESPFSPERHLVEPHVVHSPSPSLPPHPHISLVQSSVTRHCLSTRVQVVRLQRLLLLLSQNQRTVALQ